MNQKPVFSKKQMYLLVTYAIFLFMILQHFDVVKKVFFWLMAMLEPVFFGIVIAFILNLLSGIFKRKLFKQLATSDDKRKRTLCTILCALCTVLCVVTIVLLFVFMIIPQLTTAVNTLIERIPSAAVQLKPTLMKKLSEWRIPESVIAKVETFEFDWNKITNWLIAFMDGKLETVLGNAMNATTSVLSSFTNFIIGIIIAIYILAKKERVKAYIEYLPKLIFPKRYHSSAARILHLANVSCANFLTGQFIEAIIIGVLCTIGLTICQFPFATTIGVLTGITALIPIIGAWIGGSIGVLLIWVDSPEKVIWFIVFILVLQLLEGQLIYPKVVGDSLGLPGLVVLIAVLLGTSFGGITGIFIAVPLSAILFTLLKEAVDRIQTREEETKKTESAAPIAQPSPAPLYGMDGEESLVEDLLTADSPKASVQKTSVQTKNPPRKAKRKKK